MDAALREVATTDLLLLGLAWSAMRIGLSTPSAPVVAVALTSHVLLVRLLVDLSHLGSPGMTATLGGDAVAKRVALLVMARWFFTGLDQVRHLRPTRPQWGLRAGASARRVVHQLATSAAQEGLGAAN